MRQTLWASGPRALCVAAAAFAALGGTASFLGWILEIPRLTDWYGVGIAIKANTAIGLVIAGVSLFLVLYAPRAKPAIRALAAVLAALGVLTLLEHITGWDFGIDMLLVQEPPGAPATAAPGRMGPPAALSFAAIGVALMLLTSNARARGVAVGLGLAVLALGTLSITGYWFQAKAIYMIPRLTGIALQTASMLVAVGIAIISADAERQPIKTLFEDSNAGALARRLLPLAFIVPLGLGWLRLSGQRAGLYDAAFGTALRSVTEVAILSAVMWWGLNVLRQRDHEQATGSAKLRDSEKRLIDTLESITDAFVTLDPKWRFTFVNAAAEQVLHRSRHELLGQVLWDLFPEWLGSPLRAAFLRAVRERVMIEVEAPDPNREGHEFLHRIYPNPDGGFSVYFQDVTLRNRSEAALKDADRRKDEFLATLAHELRNPLGPVRNAAQVLLAKGDDPAMQSWAAGIISRQVHHMARLLDDLLDVSRIARNRLELRREQTELAPIIQSAVEASRPVIDQAKHSLILNVPSQPIHLVADAVRLTQVLSNLLNNSAKYTRQNGRIELSVATEASEVVIRVKDDGIGIDREMLPKVFDMFSQASSALPHAQGGLGIGLALARGVIELHGGRIDAASEGTDRGSEFTVRLPRLSAPFDEPISPAHADQQAQPSRRMLVVDDLRDNADSLARLLESLGHEVHTAYDGEQGLQLAQSSRPEVVFLDLGMPVMDGYALCRRIRELPWGREALIIAVTGWGQPEDRRRTLEAGFDHHFIKPVEVGVIVEVLELSR